MLEHDWKYVGGGGPEGCHDYFVCQFCKIQIAVRSKEQLKALSIPACLGRDKFAIERLWLKVLEKEAKAIRRKLDAYSLPEPCYYPWVKQ